MRLPWLVGFLSLALVYIATEFARPYPLHYLVKALPIFLLIAFVSISMQGRLRTMLLAALVFSAGGDILLSLTFTHQFVAGLSSFLVAQVIYAAIFFGFRTGEYVRAKGMLSLGVIVYGALMASLILPDDQVMRIAVVCYLVVISAMAMAAVWAWRRSLLHIVGAFTFVVSDSLIAWNSFREPLPYASALVMTTYYAAQLMLVIGSSRREKETAHV